ncbi:unnamed protein product [Brassicogethes aeneus]|uniref:Uncharacterized protein n=1 Tax=Brassicogethes aeneus TaxID=1431903 RepID=A0A9P0AWP1_BRAAE|nr:unnamed protein product [Brassicogethes aeneus]
MKWNVKNMGQNVSIRMEYKERAHYREVYDTGKLEPFTPLISRLFRTTITILTVLCMGVVLLIVTLLLLLLRLNLSRTWSGYSSYRPPGIFLEVFPQVAVNFVVAIMIIVLQPVCISFLLNRFALF